MGARRLTLVTDPELEAARAAEAQRARERDEERVRRRYEALADRGLVEYVGDGTDRFRATVLGLQTASAIAILVGEDPRPYLLEEERLRSRR